MSNLRKKLAEKLMKKTASKASLLKALHNFHNAFENLVNEFNNDENDTVAQDDVIAKYPFNVSFDELKIKEWVAAFEEYLKDK